MTQSAHRRQPYIDALKLIAAQCIVLHHLVAYGPLAEALEAAAPRVIDWIFEYSRMAVQIFLVVGGFLAARSLAPLGQLRGGSVGRAIAQRYGRLVLPFVIALLFTVICSYLARQWLDADFIPATPSWGQLLAHVLLLQGVLGQASLSAGVWYVAIDFQLFVLMIVLLWLGRGWRRPVVGVLLVMLVSLFVLNRDEDLDNWAVYFFGAYGLGAAAFWAGKSSRPGMYLSALAGLGLLALAVDFRERIALALAVAMLLGWVQWRDARGQSTAFLPLAWQGWVGRFGASSYALFLVHFSVLMLGNAAFAHFGGVGGGAALLCLLLCWVCCITLAQIFERWVERPLSHF